MEFSHPTVKNLSNEYKDFPPGCVPCPKGSKPGNPGVFDEIHKKFDNLNPHLFDGVRIIVKKILSNSFNVTHTLALCSQNSVQTISQIGEEKEGYKFASSYTGIKRVGYKEKYPILYGDITPSGNLTANFIQTIGCRLRLKFSTQVKRNKFKNSKTSIEYRSDDFTLTASLVNPYILKQEGVLLLQYIQAITSRTTVGLELACDRNSKLPGGHQANIAGALRYSTGFRTLSATFGKAGVRLCYHHKQSQQLQMGVEFKSNWRTRESEARIVYQLDMPLADLVFQGFVDTNWRVGAVFEKKLYPIPEASLAISGLIDHTKQNVNVGIGLNIG